MILSKLLDSGKIVERLFCYPVCIMGNRDTNFSFGGNHNDYIKNNGT